MRRQEMTRERRAGLDGVDVGAPPQELGRRLTGARADLDHPGALAEPTSFFERREDLGRVAGPAGGVACWILVEGRRELAHRDIVPGQAAGSAAGRIERPLDLSRSLEHERNELGPSRGTDTRSSAH